MASQETSLASTILVTGCSGYIGSHLNKDLEFLGIDHDQETRYLSDFSPLNPKFRNVRKVIHLADRRLQHINANNLKKNIEMHKEFLKKLSDLPSLERVIFSSSCSVYGYSEEIISEESRVQPTSFYAESKLAVEEFLKQENMPHQIFRFGTAFGWSANMRQDLLINELAVAAFESRVVEIYSPEAWRPYIHCKDFALTLVKSLNEPLSGPLNIVTENATKIDLIKRAPLREANLQYRIFPKDDFRNYKVLIDPSRFFNPLMIDDGLLEIMRELDDREK